MKQFRLLLIAAFFIIAGNSFAQTAQPATPGKATVVKKEMKTRKTVTSTSVKTKSDGTPDKRYAENKKLKADGTPDKRYSENKNLKKDGTPDKRYRVKHDSIRVVKKKS